MLKKDRVKETIKRLDVYYPGLDKCYLNYSVPYELLFATILSAQCTDDRVNMTTKKLFKRYKCLNDYANALIEELEIAVKSTGFYRNKARHLKGSAAMLINEYDSILPSEIEKLILLPGVGRKTANVVRSHIFKIPSVVVDTHVKRISNRLGIAKSKDPVKIEFELMKALPKKNYIRYNQQVIAFGREICKSQNPKCEICFLRDVCQELKKKTKKIK